MHESLSVYLFEQLHIAIAAKKNDATHISRPLQIRLISKSRPSYLSFPVTSDHTQSCLLAVICTLRCLFIGCRLG